MKTKIITLSILTTLLISGCDSTSTQTVSDLETQDVTTQISTIEGQLVDSYVANVDYKCADNATGVTDFNGSFHCNSLPVEFYIGGLRLGQVDTLPSDSHLFPQDLVHVPRTETNDTEVIAMAQFLQSCDDDNNSMNGIHIKDEVKVSLENHHEDFNASNIDEYATEADIELVEHNDAQNHLEHTTSFVEHVDNHSETLPTIVTTALLTPNSILTQDAINTLSYMGNEERLAHDVYLELYDYHLNNGDEIKALTNIATKSETVHVNTVQAFVQKYITDVNQFTNIDAPELNYKDTNISDMVMGTYDIEHIQDLHDILIAKGEQSVEDALEVGCMVEVTDINDLNEKLTIVEDSNASDLVSAYTFLRDASYSHYWAFDRSLKNMNVSDGCCVLGEVDGVNYCHPEYPQNSNEDYGVENDNNETHQYGNQSQNGNGEGHQYGKNR